jgi:hypothetical protein
MNQPPTGALPAPAFGMSFFGASVVGGTTAVPQPELYDLLQQLPHEKQEKQLFSFEQQLDKQHEPQPDPQPQLQHEPQEKQQPLLVVGHGAATTGAGAAALGAAGAATGAAAVAQP